MYIELKLKFTIATRNQILEYRQIYSNIKFWDKDQNEKIEVGKFHKLDEIQPILEVYISHGY